MDEQPNLREFLDEVSTFADESPASTSAAAAAVLDPIGEVVEIAGSGSQIRMDAAALTSLQSNPDPSVAMSGQVGSQVKMAVGKSWLIANVRTMKSGANGEVLAAIDFLGEGSRDANGGNVRQLTTAEQDAKIEQAVAAWRALTCSSAPITRVPVPAGTDPDYLDEFFRGNPAGSANYAQPADIVEAGWQPPGFFNAIAGPDGDFILGITFTFYFTDGAGTPTDIDRNGKAHAALAEIFYNAGYYFGDRAANSVDFFSILAHETGHGLGLGHFGKLFVTAKDAADGITASDVKFAPLALMNAGYVFPNVIQGTDNSQFCQIWASR